MFVVGDLAYVHAKKRDYTLAQELLQEALAIRQSIRDGLNIIAHSNTLVQLAKVQLDMGILGDTRIILGEALQLREEYYGGEHR